MTLPTKKIWSFRTYLENILKTLLFLPLPSHLILQTLEWILHHYLWDLLDHNKQWEVKKKGLCTLARHSDFRGWKIGCVCVKSAFSTSIPIEKISHDWKRGSVTGIKYVVKFQKCSNYNANFKMIFTPLSGISFSNLL